MLVKRGTVIHRWMGRGFAAAALLTALSSFFIHQINQWGIWSWIHLLSIYTIFATITGVRAIRRGDMRLHMQTMIPMYVFGFVVAGAFTLMPGRMTFEVFLRPTYEMLFSPNGDFSAIVTWALPALGVLIAVFVYWFTLVRPSRKRAARKQAISA